MSEKVTPADVPLGTRWKMVIAELLAWWIIGVVWGIIAVTTLGLVVPYPTIIFVSAYWMWSNSPLGQQSRYWLYTRVHKTNN